MKVTTLDLVSDEDQNGLDQKLDCDIAVCAELKAIKMVIRDGTREMSIVMRSKFALEFATLIVNSALKADPDLYKGRTEAPALPTPPVVN